MAESIYDMAKGSMAGSEPKPSKRLHHIHTRKSANGGHIHEHHFTHPEHHKMTEHTSKGNSGLVDHMMEHMGSPSPGEAEADAGQSGIPSALPVGGSPAGGAPAGPTPQAAVSPGSPAVAMQGA